MVVVVVVVVVLLVVVELVVDGPWPMQYFPLYICMLHQILQMTAL